MDEDDYSPIPKEPISYDKQVTPCDVLGVSKDASQAEINDAYDTIVQQGLLAPYGDTYHEEMLTNATRAHLVLSIPSLKEAYDENFTRAKKVAFGQENPLAKLGLKFAKTDDPELAYDEAMSLLSDVTYYQLLEVSLNASDKEIAMSYQEKAVFYEKLANRGDYAASAILGAIEKAYEILGNNARKNVYDQYLTDQEVGSVSNASDGDKAYYHQSAAEAADRYMPIELTPFAHLKDDINDEYGRMIRENDFGNKPPPYYYVDMKDSSINARYIHGDGTKNITTLNRGLLQKRSIETAISILSHEIGHAADGKLQYRDKLADKIYQAFNGLVGSVVGISSAKAFNDYVHEVVGNVDLLLDVVTTVPTATAAGMMVALALDKTLSPQEKIDNLVSSLPAEYYADRSASEDMGKARYIEDFLEFYLPDVKEQLKSYYPNLDLQVGKADQRAYYDPAKDRFKLKYFLDSMKTHPNPSDRIQSVIDAPHNNNGTFTSFTPDASDPKQIIMTEDDLSQPRYQDRSTSYAPEGEGLLSYTDLAITHRGISKGS